MPKNVLLRVSESRCFVPLCFLGLPLWSFEPPLTQLIIPSVIMFVGFNGGNPLVARGCGSLDLPADAEAHGLTELSGEDGFAGQGPFFAMIGPGHISSKIERQSG